MNTRPALLLLPAALALSALVSASAQDAQTPVSAEEALADQSTATTVWRFDPAHTSIVFQIDHMGLADVFGRFNEVEGEILANTDNPTESSVSFAAQVASIDTGVAERDEHLLSEDFFAAEEHPQITFKSHEVEAIDGGYLVTGDLTIRGETEEIELPMTVTGPIEGMQGEQRLGARGQLTIDRTDFGVDYGTEMIGTAVMIHLQVEALLEGGDQPASEETEEPEGTEETGTPAEEDPASE